MSNEDIGRNDPCHCGSGKKYKNCHYSSDREKRPEVLLHDDAGHISPRHRQFLGMPMSPDISGAGTGRAIKNAYGLIIAISLFSLMALLFYFVLH